MRNPIASLLLVAALPAALPAADYEMYGIRISRDDYIGASFVSARGTTAVVDLGYAHGVAAGNRFWVFRPGNHGHERICDLEIVRADRKTSVGRATLDVDFRPGDIFIIKAEYLNLWSSRDSADEEVLTRLALRQSRGRYDSRDTSMTADDLLEHPQPSTLRYRLWTKFVADVRPRGRVYVDLSRLRERLRHRTEIDALTFQLEPNINDFVAKLEGVQESSSRRNELPTIVKPALDRLRKIRDEARGTGPEAGEVVDEGSVAGSS